MKFRMYRQPYTKDVYSVYLPIENSRYDKGHFFKEDEHEIPAITNILLSKFPNAKVYLHETPSDGTWVMGHNTRTDTGKIIMMRLTTKKDKALIREMNTSTDEDPNDLFIEI